MVETEENQSPLQRAIAQAITDSGKKREFFDRIIQQQTGRTGKPIWDIMRGRSKNPSIDTIRLIAAALEKPVSYFTGDDDDFEVPEITTDQGGEPGNSVALRRVDLKFSMGDGSNIDDYVEEEQFDFDANLLRTVTRAPPQRLFVASGHGDSMMPTLLDHDIVLIDTTQTNLNMADRVWAISLYGMGGIKRLRFVAKDKVEVISDNPLQGNQVVDAQDLRILGRVVWLGRRM